MVRNQRGSDQQLSYNVALVQLEALLEYNDSSLLGRISSLANASALLAACLPSINWLGFYLVNEEKGPPELVLGPFQGGPACTTIAFGKGVCGTAWKEKQVMIVPDVRQFPGHIACDAASRSEVVVPLEAGSIIHGVLDVDSPQVNRFSSEDVEFLKKAAQIVSRIYPDA